MACPQLDPVLCRERQQRLIAATADFDLDLIVLSKPESIQWVSGWRTATCFTPIMAIDPNGTAILSLPRRDEESIAAVDVRIPYDATRYCTIIDEQRETSSAALASVVPRPRRVGCEYSDVGQYLMKAWQAESVDIESTVHRLRRRKDHDELIMMQKAMEVNQSLFQTAREIIRPGVREIDVYGELLEIAVRELGEPLTYFGQDFQCSSRGGPPRERRTEEGELYILDLGVGYRGYYSDNARTFAVGGNPTEEQLQAWSRISQVFELVEQRVRPGVSCRKLFDEVRQFLEQSTSLVFDHHLGHGIGLSAHESPHLNPFWDDYFEEGDVIAVEPGLYHSSLRSGVRLEQNYLVTADHLCLLSDWTLEMC